MIHDTKVLTAYDIVDYGLQFFIGLLMFMFLGWCVYHIIKCCKIIRENIIRNNINK